MGVVSFMSGVIDIDVEVRLVDAETRLTHLEAELEKFKEEFKYHLSNLHQVEVCEK
jgi:hypothetical protein